MLNALFGDLLNKLPPPTLPMWAIDESQHRLVLLLNHVLMQEPEAMIRLARLKGRIVCVEWRALKMAVTATPAGLLERALTHAAADLKLLITEESPMALIQSVFSGGKPAISIEGDVQLAAEINWLADHVRWDIEEDLSRVVGDASAHAVVSTVQQIIAGLKAFLVTKVVDSDVKDSESTGMTAKVSL
jgi:ubiquinone biosynthesis protein UbiJ